MNASVFDLGAPLLRQAALAALALLAFRGVPLTAYALLAPRVRLPGKALAVVVYLAVCTALIAFDRATFAFVVDVMSAWLYLLLAGLFTFGMSAPGIVARLTPGAVAVLSVLAWLVMPGLVLRGPACTLLLAFGFERMFAGHSYCVEIGAKGRSRRLADCLHFMLVDPSLVYVSRAQPIGPARLSTRGTLRALGGCAVLMLQTAGGVLLATFGLGYDQQIFSLAPQEFSVGIAARLSAQLFVQYLGHSGQASVMIGAFALFGFQLAERYRYPFLARSPADLWRRWNTYLGLWLQRYVFFPLAMHVQRRARWVPRELAKGGAALVAFAACGFAHELAGYMRNFVWPMGALLGFVLCGFGVLIWVVLTRLTAILSARWHWARGRLGSVCGDLVGGLMTASLLVLFAWVSLPGLSGMGLPSRLVRLLLP